MQNEQYLVLVLETIQDLIFDKFVGKYACCHSTPHLTSFAKFAQLKAWGLHHFPFRKGATMLSSRMLWYGIEKLHCFLHFVSSLTMWPFAYKVNNLKRTLWGFCWFFFCQSWKISWNLPYVSKWFRNMLTKEFKS